MTIPQKRLTGILSGVGVLLFAPLIAMQFTSEVNWTPIDFVAAAVLLGGTGLLSELVWRKLRRPRHRIAICAVLLVSLLLIWVELAVGIFGTPLAGH